MEIKEMIRKVYQKNGVKVDEEYIENKIKDTEKIKQFIRIYRQEEMESMNYILGKPEDNKIFTEFELEACSKIDLFNRTTVKICRKIWKNREKPQKVEEILKEVNV